jgi:hypothetical protein
MPSEEISLEDGETSLGGTRLRPRRRPPSAHRRQALHAVGVTLGPRHTVSGQPRDYSSHHSPRFTSSLVWTNSFMSRHAWSTATTKSPVNSAGSSMIRTSTAASEGTELSPRRSDIDSGLSTRWMTACPPRKPRLIVGKSRSGSRTSRLPSPRGLNSRKRPSNSSGVDLTSIGEDRPLVSRNRWSFT